MKKESELAPYQHKNPLTRSLCFALVPKAYPPHKNSKLLETSQMMFLFCSKSQWLLISLTVQDLMV